jgi:hypothetical protein
MSKTRSRRKVLLRNTETLAPDVRPRARLSTPLARCVNRCERRASFVSRFFGLELGDAIGDHARTCSDFEAAVLHHHRANTDSEIQSPFGIA